MRTRFCLCLGVAAALTGAARADVRLPAVFSDHAVLQQGMAVPIWGWADPGEQVEVTVGSAKASATADAEGRWRVKVGPLEKGGPLALTVKGKNTLTVKDVLVGEVWLCSGQSNMAMTVSRCKDLEVEQKAAGLPQIRMFRTASSAAVEPQADCQGSWIVCSPATVGGFTGTGYFFAREVHRRLGVPVGLLNSSVGGTAIEAWTSMEVQKDLPRLRPVFEPWEKAQAAWNEARAKADHAKRLEAWKQAAARAKAEGKTPPRRPPAPVEPRLDRNHPARLFNGMIAPLVSYAIRGALWYQGERNARTEQTAGLYRLQLPLLVKDWRDRWGQGNFPFFWVQLPGFKKPTDDPGAPSAWAVLRESMRESLDIPRSGMAITIDVGEADDIHPRNKQDVGKRLALLALGQVYDQEGPTSGPLPESARLAAGEVALAFRHADGGLKTQDGAAPAGFALAGKDGRWHWADARIEGGRVLVSSKEVRQPAMVRYAFADNPKCNLCNGAGLPASPFQLKVAGR